MKDLMLAVINLVGVILTGFVAVYIKNKTDLTKRQKGVNALEEMSVWVKQAVKWAEQTYSGTKRGQEKLKAVQEFMREKAPWLDSETINILIESAVFEMNKFKDALVKD